MPTVANINERLVNQATPMVVARYTPQTTGPFSVMVYLRVLSAVSMLLTELTWMDAGGAQSVFLTGGSYDEGSYTVPPTYISATTAADIVVSVETSASSVVRASVAIKDQ